MRFLYCKAACSGVNWNLRTVWTAGIIGTTETTGIERRERLWPWEGRVETNCGTKLFEVTKSDVIELLSSSSPSSGSSSPSSSSPSSVSSLKSSFWLELDGTEFELCPRTIGTFLF
jgi:hypothetical protein